MNCYNCGCSLSKNDFCTNCGIDIAKYKKIILYSNSFYNEGLVRANVRDLSGAILSLRQSLKFNRNNIQARNLLGLVYFEMGEVVAALSEWIISKNLQADKNVADDYIGAVQNNTSKLEIINQTIKKYNKALVYANQDSKDLAIIQLKKVLSLNPNFVRAHQLLALLYINFEEWEKAKRELDRCIKIDINNIKVLRFLKIVNIVIEEKEEKGGNKKTKKVRDLPYQYQSGNEIIIQPPQGKQKHKLSGVLNGILGVGVGILLSWFLIMPAKIQEEQNILAVKNKDLGEQLDSKNSDLVELERQLAVMLSDNVQLENELANYSGDDGALKVNDNLLMAANEFINEPELLEEVAKYLEEIPKEFLESDASTAFVKLYESLLAQAGEEIARDYYAIGNTAYKQEDYTTAIVNLEKAWIFNHNDAQILYNLANAHYDNGDTDLAIGYYNQVVELFPNSNVAYNSTKVLQTIES